MTEHAAVGIIVINCTPAMADVISGKMPKPSAWDQTEPYCTWLNATPARRVVCGIGPGRGISDPALIASVDSPYPPFYATYCDTVHLCAVNEDGTRLAVRQLVVPVGPPTQTAVPCVEPDDYEDQHMHDDVGPEIRAARRGMRAYREFLGY